MPIPTFNTDLTLINAADSTSNWSGWGQNTGKWGTDTEIYKENGISIGCTPNQTGEGGYGYVYPSGNFNATTNLVFVWIYVVSPVFVNTKALHGVYIRLATGSDWISNYKDYDVGGNDIAWVGKGWHLVVLDSNRTADRSNGSPTMTAITRVGVGFNFAATSTKSTSHAIDIMRYGTKFEVTGVYSNDSGGNGLDFNDNGGSADTITRDDAGSFVTDGWESGDTAVVTGTTYNNGEYVVTGVAAATLTLSTGDLAQTELNVTAAYVDAVINFQHIIDKDESDDTAYGIVAKNALGIYEINGPLYIGDEAGALRIYFRASGQTIYFTDQPTSNAGLTLSTKEDTGKTVFEIGESTGTGDDRVGFGGSIFGDADEVFGKRGKLDLSANITTCYVYGSTFSLGQGLSFSTTTTHRIFNCVFSNSGQVALGSVEARNLTFTGYDVSTDAALLWNGNINIKNSSFFANRNSTTNATAIEHPTAGSYDYYGLVFAGNDYDIDFSAASGTLTINATDSDPSTYEITGGGSSVTINNTVAVEITVKDKDNNAIQNAQVTVRKSTPTTYSSHATNNSQGDTTFEIQESITADTPSTGWVRVTDVSTGQDHLYRFASWSSSTFTLRTKVGPYACTAGGSSTILKDTGRDVTALDIKVGDTIRNETDGSWAIVLEIVDSDTIRTSILQGGSDNTWSTSDNYSVHTLAVNYDGNDDAETPILLELTNASGLASIANYNYQGSVAITVHVRKSTTIPAYKPVKTTGTITGDGYETVVVLQLDPNFDL